MPCIELKDEKRREEKRREYETTKREDEAIMLRRIQAVQHASLA
jgi:hypothetical protein